MKDRYICRKIHVALCLKCQVVFEVEGRYFVKQHIELRVVK